MRWWLILILLAGCQSPASDVQADASPESAPAEAQNRTIFHLGLPFQPVRADDSILLSGDGLKVAYIDIDGPWSLTGNPARGVAVMPFPVHGQCQEVDAAFASNDGPPVDGGFGGPAGKYVIAHFGGEGELQFNRFGVDEQTTINWTETGALRHNSARLDATSTGPNAQWDLEYATQEVAIRLVIVTVFVDGQSQAIGSETTEILGTCGRQLVSGIGSFIPEESRSLQLTAIVNGTFEGSANHSRTYEDANFAIMVDELVFLAVEA